jgi:tRNA pseudouridine38-40 synthase
MQRYFIEVGYKGTAYAGFQIQQNANTIQAEVEKALLVYFKTAFQLTGSSRTDAGVHALQNYFHFDADTLPVNDTLDKTVYHINAILPSDIVVKKIIQVSKEAHCRFDATCRGYEYTLYTNKNPFLDEVAFYYPYSLNKELLIQAAALVLANKCFESFAKKNIQVHTFDCTITESIWTFENDVIKYNVTGNRFLRGMVRGLVGTMLKVGREKITLQKFASILVASNSDETDFSTPAKGLCLKEVRYPFSK